LVIVTMTFIAIQRAKKIRTREHGA
jgi:hypothetical protein